MVNFFIEKPKTFQKELPRSLKKLKLSRNESYYQQLTKFDKVENKIKSFLEGHMGTRKQRKTLSVIIHQNESQTFDQSDAADKYALYVNQTIGLLYQPFTFWIIWSYYNEINIALSWGIKEKDFIYYFLFSIVIIPFQFVIDVLNYNMELFFYDIDMMKAFSFWRQSFEARTSEWKAFDPADEGLEYEKRNLYNDCYSSQTFFSVALQTSGIIILLLGVMAVI